jgi:hypothetical protein
MSSMIAFSGEASTSSAPEPAVLAHAAISSAAVLNFLAASSNPAPSPEPVLVPTELGSATESPLTARKYLTIQGKEAIIFFHDFIQDW